MLGSLFNNFGLSTEKALFPHLLSTGGSQRESDEDLRPGLGGVKG